MKKLFNKNYTIYLLNKKTLNTVTLKHWKILALIIINCAILGGIIDIIYRMYNKPTYIIDEETRLIVLNEHNIFSEEKLASYMGELNLKFPWIVLAQARVESGDYTSRRFKEDHNLFGMREAKARVTTAKGSIGNHAYYGNWRESVLDYAFLQCKHMSGISSEAMYYEYLSQYYAEDPGYVTALKAKVIKHNLKKYFSNDNRTNVHRAK